MNKIKVEKCFESRGCEVKVGELNFEMEFDLKKVLGLVVESEIEDNKKNGDSVEFQGLAEQAGTVALADIADR